MAQLYTKTLAICMLSPTIALAAPSPGSINVTAPTAIQYHCSGKACDGSSSGKFTSKSFSLGGNQAINLELYDPKGTHFCTLSGYEIVSCFRGVCGYRLKTTAQNFQTTQASGYSCHDSGELDGQHDTLTISA